MPRVVFGSRSADDDGDAPLNESAAAIEFIRANTQLRPVPYLPEIMLHLADGFLPLWQRTEDELSKIGLPPPFWAFAWAGGQAIARHILDNPALVAGKSVLDLGSGSGLAAIAAAKAGAANIVAAEIDPFAGHAIVLNAQANGVHVEVTSENLIAASVPAPSRCDVLLVGDMFYEGGTAAYAIDFLNRSHITGARVLIGDPGRAYLPKDRLLQVAEYHIPVTRELEDKEILHTIVWTLR